MSARRTFPEVLLFDLDDTILRFTAGQPDAWRLALGQHIPDANVPEQMLGAIARVAEEFWSDPERAYWGRLNMFEARRIVAERALTPYGVPASLARLVGETMTRTKEDLVCPFEGAIETLDALIHHGHRLGLLTNGSSEFQRRKLERYDLERRFELILVEGELGYGKPDPRVFRRALEFFGVLPEATTMIGDRLGSDVFAAQTLGIPGIWHDCYGQGVPPDAPMAPARVIRRISELV